MKTLLKSFIRGTVHSSLLLVERQMLARQPESQWPHIFILGAPRSGTSLFYEAMVAGFNFAYFSNLAHRFYKTPVTVTKLGKRSIRNHAASYQSDYGHIEGWAAPNEGGWIWKRWLEDGPWIDEYMLPNLPVDEIRATLAGMSAVLSAPFINKNVMHSNRIRLLDALFPNCLFIEVRRDPKDTARSIIRAQQREKGPKRNYDDWWSVRPSNAGGETLVERACRQVIGVSQDIDRDCSHLGPDRLFRIDYRAFCENPSCVLAETAGFLGKHGIPTATRNTVPSHFTFKETKPLEPEVEVHLSELLQSPTREF